MVITMCNYNFLFPEANSKEGEVILGILHSVLCLQEVVHFVDMLCGTGIVLRALDGKAFCVHYDGTQLSFLDLSFLQCLLHLCHLVAGRTEAGVKRKINKKRLGLGISQLKIDKEEIEVLG